MAMPLDKAFKQAIHDLNGLPKGVELPEKTKLRLYGLYCSVVKGPNLPPVSSEELMRSKTEALKRKAWKDALKLSRNQAMEEYCEIVKELKRDTKRPVTMSGNLYRKDNQLGWLRCYVELKERVIYYYDYVKQDQAENSSANRDGASAYPSGVLFLMDGCVVSSAGEGPQKVTLASPLLAPASVQIKEGTNELFVFTIAHPKAHKVFTLGASIRDDAQRWMDGIRFESTRKQGLGSTSSLTGAAMTTNADNFKDSFDSRYFLPPVRSSQDFGVPAAFAFTVDECIANFLNLCSDASLWNFYHERLNVRTFIQSGDSLPGVGEGDARSIVGVLGHAIQINAPVRCVFELVWSMGARRNVDPQLESWSVIEELGPQTRVDHIMYSAVWPTSKRDFCRLSHYRVDEKDGTVLVVGVSVNHLMCPNSRDAVRAKLFCTGFLIIPISERTCQVKYLIAVDPVLSSIPRRFIMSVAVSQTSILEKMETYFADHEYLVNGTLLKGPVKNIALTSPDLVKRKKKRSTASLISSIMSGGGTQFVKNIGFGEAETALPPLKETVVKVIFDDDQQERWWLKVWFIAVACAVVTSSLEASSLNLLALVLASWGVVLNPSRKAYVTGQLLVPTTMDRTYVTLMLQRCLKECNSMNGCFSFFGRWQPAKQSRVALLSDVQAGNAVIFTEFAQRSEEDLLVEETEAGGNYTALFVTQALVSDHSRWTAAPVLFSSFGDRLLVSVDRRCVQDFNRFFELAVSLLGEELVDHKHSVAIPGPGISAQLGSNRQDTLQSSGDFSSPVHASRRDTAGSERMLLRQDSSASRRGPTLIRENSNRSVT